MSKRSQPIVHGKLAYKKSQDFFGRTVCGEKDRPHPSLNKIIYLFVSFQLYLALFCRKLNLETIYSAEGYVHTFQRQRNYLYMISHNAFAQPAVPMVLTLDGSSEYAAHMRKKQFVVLKEQFILLFSVNINALNGSYHLSCAYLYLKYHLIEEPWMCRPISSLGI